MPDAWLEIHVFGRKPEGEGIVIRLPNKRFAVVDSCGLTEPEDNPMVAFLQDRGVKSLAFACLTHPHADHYRGLLSIIELFPPDFFLRSPAFSGTEVRRLVEYELRKAKSASDKRKAHEMKRLEQHMLTKRLPVKFGGSTTRVYPKSLVKNPTLTIHSFAPCGAQVLEYSESLGKCWTPLGTMKEKFPNLKHNDISVGLIVRGKRFSIVLGGDVTQSNWLAALDEHSFEDAIFVKVSHHGSKTGVCAGQWETFSRNQPPVSVTTSWKDELPEQSVLQKVTKHSKETYCTGGHVLKLRRFFLGLDSIEDALCASRRQLSLKTAESGFPIVCESVENGPVGRCSFYFDKNGNVLEKEIVSPATQV